MTLRTRSVLVFLALVMFAFSVVFIIATLTGLTVPSTLATAEAAVGAVVVAAIVTILVPATIVQEERLTVRAPREAVYAAIADPRPGPAPHAGDRGGGRSCGRARCGRYALADDAGERHGLHF